MSDVASQYLYPYLNDTSTTTLWYADENSALALAPHAKLSIISNRYDFVSAAKQQGFQAYFNDFEIIPELHTVERVVYRVSKEKSVTHHILNQAAQLLQDKNGELIISGYKNDGIKNYADKLRTIKQAHGKLKKKGNTYTGCFTKLNTTDLDDKHYTQLHLIENQMGSTFHSKPGIFGWNKIDKGTTLLLETFSEWLPQKHEFKQVLDLGCGYGWIFLNLDHYNFEKIFATDNNAAALRAAHANAKTLHSPVEVFASDSANTLSQKVDLILCNPPFHQGFQHSKNLTEKFISACSQRLNSKGVALVVVNEFIACEKIAQTCFSKTSLLTHQNGFKVFCFVK